MNFFDEMAGVWNKTCRYDTGRIEKVLSVLQLKQGDTVLDIGTGTGVMIPLESCGGSAFDLNGPLPEAIEYWNYLSASYWLLDASMMRDMAIGRIFRLYQ